MCRVSGSHCFYGFVGNEHERGCCFSRIRKPERLKHPWTSEVLLAERSSPAWRAAGVCWGGMRSGGMDAFRRDAFANRLTPGLAADAAPGDRRVSPGDTSSISIAATRSNRSLWPSPPAGSSGSARQEPRLVPSSGAGSTQLLETVHII